MTGPERPGIPLCVDLDGTLVATDMLHEALLLLAKGSPRHLAAFPFWLRHGRAGFKHRVAARVEIDPAHLPYRPEVLDLIAQARAEGRPVILATAAPLRVARAIAGHLGLFDEVLSSEEALNLSGHYKADALTERFGERGFDYVGNGRADLPVLAHARNGWLVSADGRLRRAAMRQALETRFLPARAGGVRAWAKALRLHQWLKNGLILVPAIAAKRIAEPETLAAALLAFLSFSLFASAVYLVNDLLDLSADRRHARKSRRPFASGALPVAKGAAAAPLLALASLAVALMLPGRFLAVLIGYGIVTTLYSFWLKRQVVVDVILLAGLYTIRILAGAAATRVVPSFWLLAFSMFLFLCLAMVKRYSELRQAEDEGRMLAGRGYLPNDLPVVLAMGSGSGLVAVLILAFYTQSEIVPAHYPAAHWLWLIPPTLLYWVVRLWLKAGRGQVDDDPVLFAAKDWQSLAAAALMAAFFLLAGSGWDPW